MIINDMKKIKITTEYIREKIKEGRKRARMVEKVMRANAKSKNEPMEFNFSILQGSLGGDSKMILRDEVRERGGKNRTVLAIWENTNENKCLEIDLTDIPEEEVLSKINDICYAALNEGNNVTIKCLGE